MEEAEGGGGMEERLDVSVYGFGGPDFWQDSGFRRAEGSPPFPSWEGASGQDGEVLGVQVWRNSPCALGQSHAPSGLSFPRVRRACGTGSRAWQSWGQAEGTGLPIWFLVPLPLHLLGGGVCGGPKGGSFPERGKPVTRTVESPQAHPQAL